MSLLASIALAASGTAALPACSWDKPGVNPFMGDVVAAVDRYKDIPVATRERLKARMHKREYDEMVSIKRDGITGKAQYSSEIRDMHFGAGSVCGTVTRAKWTQTMEERGLVYCEDGQCILVPTVCRNVSRITRTRPAAAAPAAATNVASSAREMADPQGQLEMDPPSAGALGGGAPASPTSFAQQAGGGLDGSATTTPGSVTSGTAPSFGSGPGPSTGGLAVPSLPPGTITDGGLPPTTPPIPEPETWALMLAGLATVAWAARRRRAH